MKDESWCAGCRGFDALIATCKRHSKNLLELDLSQCQEWLPFIQVHYQRPPSSLHPDDMETSEVDTACWNPVSLLMSVELTGLCHMLAMLGWEPGAFCCATPVPCSRYGAQWP